MLALALPVVASELGWMAMGLVDTMMVGPQFPRGTLPTSIAPRSGAAIMRAFPAMSIIGSWIPRVPALISGETAVNTNGDKSGIAV